MSDWEVGDLAVKVGGDFSVMPKGTVSVVTGLHSGEHHPSGIIGLVLGGWDDEDDYYCFCWDPTNFRKIRPDAHEGCEEEFATLVKRKSAPSPQEREERILEALFPGVPASPSGCHPFGAEPVVSGKAGIPNAGRG